MVVQDLTISYKYTLCKLSLGRASTASIYICDSEYAVQTLSNGVQYTVHYLPPWRIKSIIYYNVHIRRLRSADTPLLHNTTKMYEGRWQSFLGNCWVGRMLIRSLPRQDRIHLCMVYSSSDYWTPSFLQFLPINFPFYYSRCAFYGLAVKTIALQIYFYFFFFWKKVCCLGSKYFFPDSSQKTNWTPWPSFFDILASFGLKNVCALFREIEWALSTITIINRFGWNFQKFFS